ncbi:unnamed protein product [marine sediment metagenome]|uniref:4Fe-4S ferredoxin-type domain-containing protein n=1 Tax=marine sediment metagenome TaxID=412755 RepID=X1ASU3_9ZZZZ
MGKRLKIIIDHAKCIAPEDCRLCLNLCQPAVLILTFTDKDYHDPKNWKIEPVFPRLCINCNLCIEGCPEKAISLRLKD